MPNITHMRQEVWDEHTKEFRLKKLPTVPDIILPVLRDDLSVSSGGSTLLGSITIPPGSVVRVTYMKYFTSDPRGALLSIVQNGSIVDYLYLPSPSENIVKDGEESPVEVLEGTVNIYLLAKFGPITSGTIYGLVLHGYYSKQEELKHLT